MENMTIGKIYKGTHEGFYGREEFIGLLVGVDDKTVTFILESGNVKKIWKENLGDCGFTRNYPQGARKLFKERYDSYKKEQKLEMKIKELKEQLDNERSKFNNFGVEIIHEKGLLSMKEFCKIVYQNLRQGLKLEMERYNYELEEPYYIGYNAKNIYISRNVYIEKWFRKASFLYEEYDGTIHFCDDYEKDKNYQSILKNNSKKLEIKKAKFKETLGLGDKYWLTYSATYEIPLKKPMTKEYAIEIAKQLSK